MKMWRVAFLVVLVLAATLLTTHVVLAHQTVTVGNYVVEYGWVNEPAVVGQPNAVVINITDQTASTSNTSQPAEVDISAFQIQVSLGGQTKMLTLQPLGENTPGQFIAPMTPTRPGTYSIHLGGTIGSTSFNTDVQPEEVQTADLVQFPPASGSSTPTNSVLWFALAGLGLGVVGTGFGVYSVFYKQSKG